ncbi:Sec1 family domain-containing protein 2 [Larimichthys crocea]|uniref:Uncharacterized protein n=1 Tax=Larimichthys crocea TaxID=215358 RepID=A0ACD3RMQ7_LARCR|nr:Sec1 family domain-containing protein 2 [Larimichthys crocea]
MSTCRRGAGRVTPEQLCSYMQLFRSSWGALESHCGVLQLGLATAQTLRHPGLTRWDACLAFERLLLQALGDSDFPTVLRQLLPLMKPRGGEDSTTSGARSKDDECGPDELILLLVYLYSLADEAHDSDEDEVEKLERELMGALTVVITREPELSPLLQKLTGCANPEELTTERAHSAMEEMFETLRGLSNTRDHLKQLRSVYTASDGVHQPRQSHTSTTIQHRSLHQHSPAHLRKADCLDNMVHTDSWFLSHVLFTYFFPTLAVAVTQAHEISGGTSGLRCFCASPACVTDAHSTEEGVHCESLFINRLFLAAYITQKGLCVILKSFVLMKTLLPFLTDSQQCSFAVAVLHGDWIVAHGRYVMNIVNRSCFRFHEWKWNKETLRVIHLQAPEQRGHPRMKQPTSDVCLCQTMKMTQLSDGEPPAPQRQPSALPLPGRRSHTLRASSHQRGCRRTQTGDPGAGSVHQITEADGYTRAALHYPKTAA